jgi:hypothetical protein
MYGTNNSPMLPKLKNDLHPKEAIDVLRLPGRRRIQADSLRRCGRIDANARW